MSENMMIAEHMLKILAIASIFFAFSCIGVGYVIHDKWQKRKAVKAGEDLMDEQAYRDYVPI